MKDDKINEQNAKIDELIQMMKESDKKSTEQVNKVLNKLDKTNNQLKETNTKLDKTNKKLSQTNDKLDDTKIILEETQEQLKDTQEQLEETDNKVTYITKKLNVAVEDRVPKTASSSKLEDFVLLKNKKKNVDFKYYAVRGQSSYVNRKIASKKEDESNKYKEIIRINDVANSVNLWIGLKESLKKKVEYCGNEMNLISINEDQFINTIKDVYEKRKLVDMINDTD